MLKNFARAISVVLAFILLLGILSPGLSIRHAQAAENEVQSNETDTRKVSKVTATFYGDSKTSRGLTWYTPKSVTGTDVQIVASSSSAVDFSTALKFTGKSYTSTNSPEESVHKAVVSGLTAGTTYAYRVGDASMNIWSETGTFRTDDGNNSFTFIDLADTQAKEEDEAALSAATLRKALQTVPNAEFIVHNGDLVDTGTKEEQWDWLLGHSQDSLLKTTIAPSAGNHEDENYGFIDHFNLDTPEDSATITGAYYSYDYGNAHFVVLNSNEDSTEHRNFSPEQVAWLKRDVTAAKANGAQWIIVNIHKGPYTTSNHATDRDIIEPNGVRNKIAPLMAELDIDFVVQGHDHIYARTKPIKSDGTADQTATINEIVGGQTVEYTVNPDGTIYMIPATAGAKVYSKNQKPALGNAYYDLFNRAEENHALKYGEDPERAGRPVRGVVQNFVAITIDGGRLTATTYEIDQVKDNGAAIPFVIDRFGIVKQTPGGNVLSEPTPPVLSEQAAQLSNEITQARGLLDLPKGIRSGQYPQSAFGDLRRAINEVSRVLEKAKTAEELSAARTKLANAVDHFKSRKKP